MSAKKKKQSNSPLRVIIILVLLGLLAYKHQLFDGKLLENIPTIESNEEKPEILTSPQHDGALEIPMIQSSTGGQILKRKGYTLSHSTIEFDRSIQQHGQHGNLLILYLLGYINIKIARY